VHGRTQRGNWEESLTEYGPVNTEINGGYETRSCGPHAESLVLEVVCQVLDR
jgi:hypothetical protein